MSIIRIGKQDIKSNARPIHICNCKNIGVLAIIILLIFTIQCHNGVVGEGESEGVGGERGQGQEGANDDKQHLGVFHKNILSKFYQTLLLAVS